MDAAPPKPAEPSDPHEDLEISKLPRATRPYNPKEDRGNRRGVFSPEQLERALAWLNEKWTQKDCPFHGPTNWDLRAAPGEVATVDGSDLTPGAAVYPFLMATCTICGYTVLVNALIAGVVRAQPPDEAAGQAPDKDE